MDEFSDKKYPNFVFGRQNFNREDVLFKPSKSMILALDKELLHANVYKRAFENLRTNFGPITLLFILCMTPRWDVYSDWAVIIQLLLPWL